MAVVSEMKSSEKEQSRATVDRRQYSYTHYIPERRSGRERRRDDDSGLSDTNPPDDRKQNSE